MAKLEQWLPKVIFRSYLNLMIQALEFSDRDEQKKTIPPLVIHTATCR
jgi:hypothetical protein